MISSLTRTWGRRAKGRQGVCITDKKTLETFVHEIMNKARPELGDLSVIEYARNKGAVYTFYTAQNSPSGIDNEAFRFLTDGQQIRGN